MQLCSACRRHVKIAPCPFCGEPELGAAALLLALAAVSAACQPAPVNDDRKEGAAPAAASAAGAVPSAAVSAGNPRFRAPSAAGGYGAPPSERK